MTATNLNGNGSGVTNVNASQLGGNASGFYTNAANLSSGLLPDARLSTNVTLQGNSFNGVSQLVQLNGSGFLPALNGSLLTSLNGTNITTGTVADTRLSGNVTLQGNTFNGASQLVQLNGSGFLPALNGSLLTSLNGTNIASGTVANARLVNSGALTVTAGSGLSGGGSVALGGSTSLSVVYGAAAGNAVQGNITLTCASGLGNLSGGGTVITLGSGGTCGNISISATPSFDNVTLGNGTGTAGTVVLRDGSTANLATVQLGGALSGAVTYNLPAATGTQTICTIETGNCAGSGAGVTTGGTHTQNFLTKFNNAGGTQITNSSIYNDATGVSVGGSSPASLFNVGASNQFQVSSAGAITGVGLNAGTGLIQGTGGLTIGGTATLTGLTSAGGQCLTTDGSGVISLVNCLSGGGGGSSGVASLNGLSGTLSINNATGLGSNITINNAKADGSTKGIATFNATNFSDNGAGVINTIQGIATTATPIFAGLTLNASGLSAGGTITFSGSGFSTDGIVTSVSGVIGSGTINLGTSGYLSGTLGVGKGGTGLGSLTSNSLLYASNSSTIGQISGGSTGQCLLGNTGSAPSFGTCTGAGGVSSITANNSAQTGALQFNGTTNQVSVTNSGSTFTFATPQDINTNSDVSFNSVNAATLLKTNGTTRIDASGNLSNIGTISTSGLITGGAGLTISTGTITFNNLAGGASKCLTLNGSNQVGVATCATGSGSSPTLQDVYDNSTTTPNILLATAGKGIRVQDASSPVGGDLFSVTDNAGTTKYLAVTVAGVNVAGTLAATSLSGNGSGVTNVNAAQLNGQAASYYLNATNINAGTLNDARLSGNVALLNANANFTGTNLQHNGNAVCDTSNNCVGVGGGGAVGGSGTLNKIPRFTGSGFTIGDSLLSQDVGATTVTVSGALSVTGSVTAASFSGDGTSVTNVNAAQLGGNNSSYYTNATNISSGTLNDGRLSGNVALLNANANFTGTNLQHNGNNVCDTSGNCTGVSGGAIGGSGTLNKIALFTGSGFTIGNSIVSQDVGATTVSIAGAVSATGNISAATFSGDGASITNLNASSLASGTIANGRLSGSYTGVTGVGALAAGSIASGFGVISTGNNITTTATLQGANLTVTGTTTLSSLTSAGGQCLTTNGSGVLSLVNCLSGAGGGTGGVASLNGDSGTLTLNNATAPDASHITIDNAKADGTTKGIATFAGGNFADNSSGLISIKSGGVTTTEILDSTIANADLAGGTYAAITGTGALAAGSIASGFGVISTGNNITTTAALQAATATLTGASSLTLGTAGPAGNTGSITFKNSTNVNTVSIVSGVTTSTYNIVLPTAAGAAGDCLVNSATPGALQFTSCSGAAGGASTSLNNLVSTSINKSLVANADNTLDLGTSSTAWRTGYFGTQVQTALLDSISGALAIGTTNATSINLNQNTVLAAGKTITISGDVTGNRPAGTKGQLYFDTTTNQLLQYNGSKWVSDHSTTTKIVAANNSTQAAKDAADYVATGTGDQATINSALTALPAGGGTVYLMEGTYNFTAGVSVPNNATLSGAGTGTILTIPNTQNSSYNFITNTDTSTGTGVTIRDLLIDGNKANNGSAVMSGIFLNGIASNAKVTNVLIKNVAGANGISLSSSSYVTLANNTITGASVEGIRVSAGSGNAITGNTIMTSGDGMFLLSTSNTVVSNNTVQSNTGYGIWLKSSTTNTVTGNTALSNSTGNIYLSNAANANTITGNTVQSSSSDGIEVSASSHNTISGNLSQGNTNAGIHLDGTTTSNNIVSGNKLYDNGGGSNENGIYLQDTSINNSITGNDISDSSCSSGCNAIVIANSGSSYNYISGNHFTGAGVNLAGISDSGTGTIYANQADASGNLINRGTAGTGINTSTVSASLSLQGGLIQTQLPTPAAPGVSKVGSGGATYGYKVTALDGLGETAASVETQISSDANPLTGVNLNTISWVAVPGAVQYKVYRTTVTSGSPVSLGLIGTVSAGTLSFNDTGIAATTAAPNTNTTGGGTFAGTLQASSGIFTGTSGLTVGTTGAATGNIALKGSTAASGTVNLTLASNNPNNITLQVFNSAAGTYTICTSDAASCGGTTGAYIALQGSTPGSAQTGNFNISGTGIASVLQSNTAAISGSSTANTLSVTSSANPAGGTNAIIVANNSNGSASGNLLALQNAGVNKFTVDAAGSVSAVSDINTSAYFKQATQIVINTTTGTSSTFLGVGAGNTTSTASFASGVGKFALNNITSGGSNTASGYSAAFNVTSGTDNTAVGTGSLFVNRTGNFNTAIGSGAGYATTCGGSCAINGNTVVGYNSGASFINGADYNTLLGYQAGGNITSGANNIIIGKNATAPSATGSNQISIGNTIYGDSSTGRVSFGAALAAGSAILNVGTSAQFTVDASGNIATSGTGLIKTNSSTAFQIADNSGTIPLLTADTTASTVTIATSAGGVLLNNGATVNGIKALSDISADGALTTAANINVYTSFTLNQTTGGGARALTLPSPTTNTAATHVIYVSNIGSASFTLAGVTLSPGTNGSFLWNGSAWSSTAVSTGVTLVGTFTGASIANGASISGNTITFGQADATNPGLVSTGAQVFAGDKTFNGNILLAAGKTLTVGTGLASFGGGIAVTAGNTDFTTSIATKKGTDFSTTGSSNDVNFGNASLVRLTGASAQTITGIAAGRDGQILIIVNAAGQSATLLNNSASSSAGNKIITGLGVVSPDLTLAAGASITLIYDSNGGAGTSFWRVVGDAADSGCSTCAKTDLSNIASTNLSAALNATGADLTLQTTTSGNIVLNSAGAVTIGGAAAAGTISLGQSTATNTINIGNAVTGSGNTQTIAIGTGATGTGSDAVTIGSTSSGSTVKLQGGAYNFNVTNTGLAINTGAFAPTADLSFGSASNRTINVLASSPGTAGKSLTIQGGVGGGSSGATNGGDLILLGGAGGSGGPSGLVQIGGIGKFTVDVNGNVVALGTLKYADSGTATTTEVCKDASGFLSACSTTGTGAAFIQGGNSFGAQAVIGTKDFNSLAFNTTNTTRAVIDTSGNLTFSQSSIISTSAANQSLSLTTAIAGISSSGSITIKTGNAAGNAGNVTIDAGSGGAFGGTVSIGVGTALAVVLGPTVYLGNASGSGIAAAPVAASVKGTSSTTAGTAGAALSISAGAGATISTGSAGGVLNLAGGAGGAATTGNANAGGSVNVTGGAAGGVGAANANGGGVTINGGTGFGATGTVGTVALQAGDGAVTIGTGASVSTSNVTIGSTNVAAQAVTLQSGTNAVAINNTSSAFTLAASAVNGFLIQSSTSAPMLNFSTASTGNLITNGSFENNPITNWLAKGAAAAPTRDTTQAYSGNASGKVITTAAIGDGIKQNVTLVAATQYTVSFYAKLDGASTSMNNDMVFGYAFDGATETTYVSPSNTVVTGGWTRYSFTFTPASISGTPYFFIKQTDAAIHTFYVDGVRLEAAANSTADGIGRFQLNSVDTAPLALQNTSNSTTAFSVQDASGINVFTVDTLNHQIIIGTGSSVVTIGATGIGGGGATHTKYISLPAEYVGAALDAASDSGGANCATNNSGIMSSGYSGDASPRQNYYQWVSGIAATSECYDVVVQVPIPADFSSWPATKPALYVSNTGSSSTAICMQIIGTSGSADANYGSYQCATGVTGTLANNTTSFPVLGSTSTNTAGSYLTIKIRMTSTGTADFTKIGNLTLQYVSAY